MATITALEIPKWGMTMEEGTVSEWLVAVGDEVVEGTALATVESSKIASEYESPAAGVVRRLLVDAGATLPVGTLIGVLADAAATDAEIDAFIAASGDTPAQAAAEPAPATVPAAASQVQVGPASPAPVAAQPTPAPALPEPAAAPGAPRIPESLRGEGNGIPATVHARRLAAEHGIALAKVTPTGRGGRVTVADILGAVTAAGGELRFGNDRPKVGRLWARRDDSDVPATRYARQVAAEHRVNLRDCKASGRAGRVTVEDVLAVAARQHPQAPAPASTPAASAAPAAAVTGSTTTAMSSMRRVIADRLKGSYLDSPHYRVTVHADCGRLMALRAEINDSRLDAKVSVNDLVVAAVAKTLVAVPEVNSHYDAARQEVTRFDHADVAVAVSTGQGLITPIVTHADTRSITEISALITDLATRAKAGTLMPDEFQGGTFTVSNLGMFGVSQFDAIINPPQVAILAVGSTQRTFVPGPDGGPVAASLLPLTLSSDHRVVDGALAARFLARLRTALETPSLIFA